MKTFRSANLSADDPAFEVIFATTKGDVRVELSLMELEDLYASVTIIMRELSLERLRAEGWTG